MSLKTMGVLAGAYPHHIRSTLTHRAEVPADGGWPVPLCSRVKLGSLTDDSTQHTDDRPTCHPCGRLFDKESR